MLQILTCRMDIAEKYGLDAAVLLHNIVYWTEKNAAENRHFHKGRYWMYATIKGFAQMYPLWSESQIRRIISRLRDSGALLVGEFNENRMLRTIWYSPSDEILTLYETGYDSESICQKQPMQVTNPADANDENGKCIYNENKKLQQEELSVVSQKTMPCQSEAQMLFDRFWAAYPKKKGKESARRAWRKLRPDMALCRVMASALDRQKQSEDWRRDGGKYIPYPASWLNGRRWEDEPDNLSDESEEGYDGI